MTAPTRPRTVARRRRFEVDRIVVLRAALVLVALLFLYLIVRVAIQAFGGASQRETRHIEYTIDNAGGPANPPAAGGVANGGAGMK